MTSPVKPHLMGSGSSCQGPPASPVLQGTPSGRRGHFSRRGAALDAGERLPPSPSDPQLGMDLRKTALLRSLLLRTEVTLFRTVYLQTARELVFFAHSSDGRISCFCDRSMQDL